MTTQHRPQREPDAQGGPVRRFTDPSYRPLAENLAGIRAEIDRIDEAIVRLMAERAMYVKDAARFKRDAFQVSAPARQAQVFAHVRDLAQRHQPAFNGGFEGLPDVVEAAYRALVAGYIACEQQYFGQTETDDNEAPKESDR
ncbi:MAG TPA: chorismate mutase [Ramlibacter sp.]|uniref:chorismate mutase n=1 Tax=Ramlibacter sp. TaxID=1917967 RepID=UPI002ED64AE7